MFLGLALRSNPQTSVSGAGYFNVELWIRTFFIPHDLETNACLQTCRLGWYIAQRDHMSLSDWLDALARASSQNCSILGSDSGSSLVLGQVCSNGVCTSAYCCNGACIPISSENSSMNTSLLNTTTSRGLLFTGYDNENLLNPPTATDRDERKGGIHPIYHGPLNPDLVQMITTMVRDAEFSSQPERLLLLLPLWFPIPVLQSLWNAMPHLYTVFYPSSRVPLLACPFSISFRHSLTCAFSI